MDSPLNTTEQFKYMNMYTYYFKGGQLVTLKTLSFYFLTLFKLLRIRKFIIYLMKYLI